MKRVVVIGAGPCGLGVAHALHTLGHGAWQVFEANTHPGGLSASFVDPRGFTWDIGGHVLFTQNELFSRLVKQALRDEYLEHIRSAWVRTHDSWVPYPFQNNLHFLPDSERDECLRGLAGRVAPGEPRHFGDWINATFGDGIARQFMLPYNRKVWGVPLEEMAFDWIAERVSVVDLEKIKQAMAAGRKDSAWGPNANFIFPTHGGTGEIFRRIASWFGDRIEYNKKMIGIDPERRVVRFADGTSVAYDILINTSPLDRLLELLRPSLEIASAPLRAAGGAIVGLGVAQPEESGRCWVYFPDAPPCFYRLTYFSHYSPNNVPGGDTGRYASYMCETVLPSLVSDATEEEIVDYTIDGLIKSGILTSEQVKKIVSTYVIPVPKIYPVPTMGLRAALRATHRALEQHDIYSRGRFGGWRYEIGNMDHSFLQGYEVVGRLLVGQAEETWGW